MTGDNSKKSADFSIEDEKILAIDFGTKRIGLAVSRLSLALPLFVIEYQDLDKALTQIKHLCQELGITRIVIGISEQEMAEKTRNFGSRLQELVDRPIEFADETMSSQTARSKLKEAGIKDPKQPVDHYAAALILDEWIDLKASKL